MDYRASAATIILRASAKEDSRCLISPVGALFVHNVQSEVYGDYRDMQRESDDLQKANKIIMEAYKLKTDFAG